MSAGSINHNVANFSRPSVFELYAQDLMESTLEPAISHALKMIGEQTRFQWATTYKDEIYFVLHMFVQQKYIYNYAGCFTEHFYGLKRVTLGGGKIPTWTKVLTLAIVVVLPYVIKKLKQLESMTHPRVEKMVKILKTVWQYLTTPMAVLSFIYRAAYILNFIDIYSPAHHITGSKLVHYDRDDMERWSLNQEHKEIKQQYELARMGSLERAVTTGMRLATDTLKFVLPASLFFLTFLEWWKVNAPPHTPPGIPEPPKAAPQHPQSKASASVSTVCPICRKIRRNSTALATSGFVFCYACIYKYVGKHQRCPVTFAPATTTSLVKLYENTM